MYVEKNIDQFSLIAEINQPPLALKVICEAKMLWLIPVYALYLVMFCELVYLLESLSQHLLWRSVRSGRVNSPRLHRAIQGCSQDDVIADLDTGYLPVMYLQMIIV